MAKEWYVWNGAQKAKAQAMLDAINADEAFPIVGTRASDGVPQPDKQLTTKWADALDESFVDGSVGFPRIPAEVLDKMNVGQTKRDAMLAAHNPNIKTEDELPARVEPDNPEEV